MKSYSPPPDRCVLCYGVITDPGGGFVEVPASFVKKENDKHLSVLEEQLQVIFLVRTILEIPKEKVTSFLRKFDNPSDWIRLCYRCNCDYIKRAKCIYGELLEVERRFKGLQQEIGRLVKESGNAGRKRIRKGPSLVITDECRAIIQARTEADYLISSPFIAGDLRALELATGGQQTIVKEEPEEDNSIFLDDPLGDDFNYEDNYANEIDGEEVDAENEWLPPNTTEPSKPKISTRRSRKFKKRSKKLVQENELIGTPSIKCPLCQKFKCSVEKGEQLCDHLESCLEEITDEKTGRLSCPICKEYNVGIEKKVDFAEHVGWCGQQDGNDSVIPLTGRIFSCDMGDGNHIKFMKLPAFLDHCLYHKRYIYKCAHCSHRFASNNSCDTTYHFRNNHPSFFHPHSSRCVHDPWLPTTLPCWCPVCGHKFQTDTLREEHIQEEHPTLVKNVTCQWCSSEFYSAEELSLHEVITHPQDIERKDKRELIRHENPSVRQSIRKRARQTSTSESEEKVSSESSEAEDEQESASTSTSDVGYSRTKFLQILKKVREKKERRCIKEISVICPLCQGFQCKLGLSEVLYHHMENCSGMNDIDKDKTLLQCPTCKQFTRKGDDQQQRIDFVEHVSSCKGEDSLIPPLGNRLFQCDVCEESERKWIRVDEFLEHYLYHIRYRYKCTKCNHRFCTDESRDTHYHYKTYHIIHYDDHPSTRSVHEPNLPQIPWWCSVCSEKFSSEEQRDSHFDEAHNYKMEADHKKKYVCQWCSKSYHCADELRLHQGTQHVYDEKQRIPKTRPEPKLTPAVKKKKTSTPGSSPCVKVAKNIKKKKRIPKELKEDSYDSGEENNELGENENSNGDEDWQPPPDVSITNSNDDHNDEEEEILTTEVSPIEETSFTKQVFQEIVKRYLKKSKKSVAAEVESSAIPFLCNICPDRPAMSLTAFLNHYLYHKRQTYRCVRCSHRFPSNTSKDTMYHYRRSHPEYVKVPSVARCVKDPALPQYSWSCFHCNEKFPTEQLRDGHMEAEHGDRKESPSRRYKCHYCPDGYPNVEELLIHLADAHVQVVKEIGAIEVKELKCSVCFEDFTRLAQLKEHQREKHKDEFSYCDMCGRQCKNEYGLRQHRERCQEAQKAQIIPEGELQEDVLPKTKHFSCSLCNEYSVRAGHGEKLCQHLDVCKKRVEWEEQGGDMAQLVVQCTLCNVYRTEIEKKTELVEHMAWCQGEEEGTEEAFTPIRSRIFECSICTKPKKYFKLAGFLAHYLYHLKSRYKCILCQRLHTSQSEINSHFIKKHRDKVKKILPSSRFHYDDRLPQFHWWCHYCNTPFPDDDLRDAHIISEHPNATIPAGSKLAKLPPVSSLSSSVKEFTCVQCSKGYDFLDELKLHEGTAHVTENSLFSCNLCQETFLKANLFRQHKIDKHQADQVVCDICGMHLKGKSLKNHMQTHQEVRMYLCEKPNCGESFATRPELKLHGFRKHAPREVDKNPLMCPHCPEPKVFYNRSYMKKHIDAVHLNKFPIQCHICGKGFQYTSKLKKHFASTHKIGTYGLHKCTFEGCGKIFNQKAILKQHMDRHRNDPQFKCQFCEKPFFKLAQLRRHELIHKNAESKPYQCEICAKRFPVRNYLYIHMRSHKNRGEIE